MVYNSPKVFRFLIAQPEKRAKPQTRECYAADGVLGYAILCRIVVIDWWTMEEIVSLVARFIGDVVLEFVIGKLFFCLPKLSCCHPFAQPSISH